MSSIKSSRGRDAALFIWASFVLYVLPLPSLAGTITLVDVRGQAISLERPATRIVSLAPHVTELLFAAGAGDRMIAAVEFSNFPAAARGLPRVGNSSRLDMERVLALSPDLVIGWQTGNDAGDIERLQRLGVKVFVTEIGSVGDIPAQIEVFGRLAGTEGTAQTAAGDLRARLAALTGEYEKREPVTVFYQIWARPLMTVNGRNFISDSIRLCGGHNVFADMEPIAPTVSIEAVIAADPQVIVASSSMEDNDVQLDAWRRWSTIRAVREGHLYSIPPDVIARPTVRIVEGVERLCELLDAARARGQGTDD